MRKLATIREIKNIKPIDGADNIELAIIDGWQCVVAKNDNFKINDKVIYFEIDSFLPQIPEFEFLKSRCLKSLGDGIFGYRLKTIKLRGEISQGLILPIDTFKKLKANKLKVGDDVSKKLGVILYEPQIKIHKQECSKKRILFNKAYSFTKSFSPKIASFIFPLLARIIFNDKKIKNFPNFIRKTDQERIQNLSNKLDYLSQFRYEVTVKLDGSSMSVYHYNNKTGLCSRNLEIDSDDNVRFNKVEQQYNIKKYLKEYGKNIAIQGELIGEGIQGNPENIDGNDFYVFDIFDIDKQRYLLYYERFVVLHELENIGCKLKHVPRIEIGYNISKMDVSDILKYAEGSSLFSNNREGVVFKSTTLSNNNVVHFKAISNKYLLKQKD